MSARSFITARLMETWAHGQEVYDVLGAERTEHDYIRNIAMLGVNTFGWTFVNRKEPVPETKPWIRLTAPSGELWEWNEPSDAERIEGPAVAFCQVVAQTRNIADVDLAAAGRHQRGAREGHRERDVGSRPGSVLFQSKHGGKLSRSSKDAHRRSGRRSPIPSA